MPVRKTSRGSKEKTDNDDSLQMDAGSEEIPIQEQLDVSKPKEPVTRGKSAPQERQLFFSTDEGEGETEIPPPPKIRLMTEYLIVRSV